MIKLTFEEARSHFAGTGDCKHDPDYFTDVDVPNTEMHLVDCRVCGKTIEKYSGYRPLVDKIEKFLTETKTRAQIYFRFDGVSPTTIRGRLSEMKKQEKILQKGDEFSPKLAVIA